MRSNLFFLIVTLLIVITLPAIAKADEIEVDIDIAADGYACYTMNFEKPYDLSVPDWEGTNPTASLTVPDDRFTEVQCQGWNWGPYDLAGNRVRIYGPLSDPEVYEPSGETPEKPNIIIRIILAVLDFFGKSSGQFSNA